MNKISPRPTPAELETGVSELVAEYNARLAAENKPAITSEDASAAVTFGLIRRPHWFKALLRLGQS